MKTERGDYKWKDETQQEVIFVPDEKGRFLVAYIKPPKKCKRL